MSLKNGLIKCALCLYIKLTVLTELHFVLQKKSVSETSVQDNTLFKQTHVKSSRPTTCLFEL